MKRHRRNDIFVDAALALLALLVAAAAGSVVRAEGSLGFAHLCSSTGKVCAKELPNLYGVNGVGFVTTSTTTAVDYGTGYGTGTGTGVGSVTYTLSGTGTATDTTSASDTMTFSGQVNTQTLTVTTTATSTTVRTQTQTAVVTWQHPLTNTKTFVGTGTVTATATATATITATLTVTATDSGTGTGTFTASATATATATKSAVVSGTYAGTATCTDSWTNSGTATWTGTWAQTATSAGTGTRTITVLLTQTGTSSLTKTGTSSLSMSGTATHTGTDTTATASVTGTASGNATGTWTSTANTTATSASVASNPTITYTPALTIVPGATVFLVGNYDTTATIHTGFDHAPYSDPSAGSNPEFILYPTVGSPAYVPCGSGPGAYGNSNCILLSRDNYLTYGGFSTPAEWVADGVIQGWLWAKSTSAASVSFTFGICSAGGFSSLAPTALTWAVSSASWQLLYTSVSVPGGGILLAPNHQLCVQIAASAASGTPTVTIGMTGVHPTSVNGPWAGCGKSTRP